MKEANNARLKKLLEKKYRHEGKIKTFKEIIDDKLNNGDKFFIVRLPDSSNIKKLTGEMVSIRKNYLIAESREAQEAGRGSNHNIPAVKRYWDIVDELFAGCTKNIYMVGDGNQGIKIPKMVHDFYINQLIA